MPLGGLKGFETVLLNMTCEAPGRSPRPPTSPRPVSKAHIRIRHPLLIDGFEKTWIWVFPVGPGGLIACGLCCFYRRAARNRNEHNYKQPQYWLLTGDIRPAFFFIGTMPNKLSLLAAEGLGNNHTQYGLSPGLPAMGLLNIQPRHIPSSYCAYVIPLLHHETRQIVS